MSSLLVVFGLLLAVLAIIVGPFSRQSALKLGAVAVILMILGSLGLSADWEPWLAVGLLVAAGVVALIRRTRVLTIVAVLAAVLVGISWTLRVSGPVDIGEAPPSDPVDECRDIAFLGLRGSGEARDAHRGYGSIVGPVRDEVVRIAADLELSLADMPIDYPAVAVIGDSEWSLLKDLNTGTLDGGGLFLQGAELGADLLEARINLIRTVCGDRTKILMVGYSQGAMAAHRALDRLSDDALSLVIGVDLIADPWREQGTVDRGTGVAPGGQGIARALLSGPPSLDTVEPRSWCHDEDPVCAWDGSPEMAGRLVIGVPAHRDAYASPQWRTAVIDALSGDAADAFPGAD